MSYTKCHVVGRACRRGGLAVESCACSRHCTVCTTSHDRAQIATNLLCLRSVDTGWYRRQHTVLTSFAGSRIWLAMCQSQRSFQRIMVSARVTRYLELENKSTKHVDFADEFSSAMVCISFEGSIRSAGHQLNTVTPDFNFVSSSDLYGL